MQTRGVVMHARAELVTWFVLFMLEMILHQRQGTKTCLFLSFLLHFFQHLKQFFVAHYAGQIMFYSFFVQFLA